MRKQKYFKKINRYFEQYECRTPIFPSCTEGYIKIVPKQSSDRINMPFLSTEVNGLLKEINLRN